MSSPSMVLQPRNRYYMYITVLTEYLVTKYFHPFLIVSSLRMDSYFVQVIYLSLIKI